MADSAGAVAAWEALFRAQVGIMRRLAADFPTQQMSFNEYDVLFNISRQPDRRIRLRNLNQHVLLTQPSVSRLIDRLAAKGYVCKLPDPGDGRGTIVAMTDDGLTAFRQVAFQHVESIDRHLGGALDAEELEELRGLCEKLQQGLT
ncbi:MarR family winged helix-turn-helix transcriptional regulator [Planctomonas deserti]|uniref:MarR family winged helix-turn-helix transcriptional regulator n=1 Tax=Planctomonas deserti TaxID=2144185 RepID=UPI001F0CD656|nr:MarR family winged helix-turn-helix transcriptional regulator [Planctomonas deserti]